MSVLGKLTPRERQIAGALADGRVLKEIAERLRISINTARNHLKTIYLKTGARNQAQLVRLVMLERMENG